MSRRLGDDEKRKKCKYNSIVWRAFDEASEGNFEYASIMFKEYIKRLAEIRHMTFPELRSKRDDIKKVILAGDTNKHKIARDFHCSRSFVSKIFKTMHIRSLNEKRAIICKALFDYLQCPELYDKVRIPLAGKKVYAVPEKHTVKDEIMERHQLGQKPVDIYNDLNFLEEQAHDLGEKGKKQNAALSYIYRIINEHMNTYSPIKNNISFTNTQEGREEFEHLEIEFKQFDDWEMLRELLMSSIIFRVIDITDQMGYKDDYMRCQVMGWLIMNNFVKKVSAGYAKYARFQTFLLQMKVDTNSNNL